MKILVCGGRDCTDQEFISFVLKLIDETKPVSALVSGGCKTWFADLKTHGGVDYLAEVWAERESIPVHRHEANWKLYGRRAGPIRNRLMLRLHPDIKFVIAFPGGRGTADMKRAAVEKGIPVIEVQDGREKKGKI
jgi:YspA, cpYpsA-related SLOG family